MLMIPSMACAQIPGLNMGVICGESTQSDYDFIINPTINTGGHRIHHIGPHLNTDHEGMYGTGITINTDHVCSWGEPCSVGAWGQFYGLGVI